MVEPIFDYQFRLILIGDSTVGKSSLLKYFTDGKFAEVIFKFTFYIFYIYCKSMTKLQNFVIFKFRPRKISGWNVLIYVVIITYIHIR